MSHLHHRVSALIDNELHGAPRRRALAHARGCAECRHELKVMLALKARMSGLATGDPSADLVCMLSNVAEARAKAPSALASGRSRLAPVLRRLLVGAGSMSVAVLSLAYVVGGPTDATPPRVSPPVDEYAADFAGNTGVAPLSDPPVGAINGNFNGGPEPAALITSGVSAATRRRLTPGTSPGDERSAVAYLRRAVMAPRDVAYDGEQQIETFGSANVSTVTVEVDHVPGQGTTFGFDHGAARPQATFVPEQDDADQSLGASVDQLVQSYDVAVVGPATLVDRRVTVIAASRGGVLDARFWIDDATGLLLRREMYDRGVLVRSTGFTSLDVTKGGFFTHLPPELEQPSVSPVSMTSAAALNDAGWTCPGKLHGSFELSGLEHVDVGGDVMRADYTDGLSTVSLFEQRGSLDPAAVAGFDSMPVGPTTVYVRYGLPTVAVWQSYDTVYTVVTDAPHDMAAHVIDELPHQASYSAGFRDRIGAGLDRLGSLVGHAS